MLAGRRVQVRVVSLTVLKIRGKARRGEGTNEKAHNAITWAIHLVRRGRQQQQSEGGSGLLCGLHLSTIKWPNLRIPKLRILKVKEPPEKDLNGKEAKEDRVKEDLLGSKIPTDNTEGIPEPGAPTLTSDPRALILAATSESSSRIPGTTTAGPR